MNIDNFNLKIFLNSFNEKLYLIPNPGNAGDSLITAATLQFLKKYNFDFEVVLKPEFNADGKIILYSGGGNFGGKDSRAGRYILKYRNQAKAYILLPHTLHNCDSTLKRLGKNVHIICREKVSYEYAINSSGAFQTYLHDDIVFQCNIKDLMKSKPQINFLPYLTKELVNRLLFRKDFDFGLGLKGFISYNMFYLNKFLHYSTSKQKTLYSFRTDVEKTGHNIPKTNLDLSAILELSSCEPELALLSAYCFLNEIDLYDEIHTNRLHIAIASCLLGKRIKLYRNNYFKNKAIYDFSINEKYNNVEWIE